MTAATAVWPAPLCDFLAKLAAEASLHVPPSTTDPTATALTNGDDVAAAAVASKSPVRLKITDAEFRELANGGTLGKERVYIGRGGRGVTPSRWGNPFRVDALCHRVQAIDRYKTHLSNSGLIEYIHEILGKDLLCHCKPEEPCHGDYLLELCRAEGAKSMATFLDDGLPVRVAQVRQEVATHSATEVAVGWHGSGPPRKVNHMGGDKPFCDGGGLCSPGRWQPGKRRLPTALPGLRATLVGQFEKAARKASGGSDDALAFMMKLAAGRLKTCPFDDDGLKETRASIRAAVGVSAAEDVVAAGQVFHLPLIAGLLRVFGDPDWAFVGGLGEGVPLGVDEELPRTPGVFEEKGKWRLADDVGPGVDTTDNYQSVAPHVDKVRELFREEAALGWMVELPEAEARAVYKDRLAIAALGVVEERDKIRVVHDGSHRVHVNHRIRVKDQVRCPGAGELRALIQERVSRGVKSFAILGDISKAHRRIKVRESDWGFQACQLDPGKVWLNTVGTYGMSPAAYWWGRFAAAALVRLGHYVAGAASEQEILLYVDDFLMIPFNKEGIVMAGVLIYMWTALGIPLRWDKCRGGNKVEWIGFWTDLWSGHLGISERRARWLSDWMSEQVKAGRTDLADFTSVLGRLCFSMGPLEYLRPFVAPLFAWAAAVGHRGSMQVPWSIAFIFEFLAAELRGEGRVSQVRIVAADLGIAFRADAKAEGQCVRLGGWECLGNTLPAHARWFSVDLNKVNAPWAFSRGEPFRTIASLELFATLLCVVTFGDAWPVGASDDVLLQGITDNLGNTFAVSKLMTS